VLFKNILLCFESILLLIIFLLIHNINLVWLVSATNIDALLNIQIYLVPYIEKDVILILFLSYVAYIINSEVVTIQIATSC